MSRPFDALYILEVIPLILPYLFVTFYITLGTILGGTIIGAVVARGKLSSNKICKAIAQTYIYIIRSTPPIVLLFIVFYGLPKIVKAWFGININNTHKGVFVVSAFIILFSATMAEIIRSAYLAVDKGQTEAALSTGLSEFQTLKNIVLPQAVKVGLPNFANSLITLIKDGALAYTVGLIDIMGKGNLIIGSNYGAYAIETYLALAVIYWLITIATEKVFNHMETAQERKVQILNRR